MLVAHGLGSTYGCLTTDPQEVPVPDALPPIDNAGPDAVIDPNWQRLLADNPLPAYYLPAAMPAQVSGWRRVAAWTTIVMLVSAASAGICLTYGPDELWRFLGFG